MIILIIGMASLGHLIADFLEPFPEVPQKPFKCNMCLSTWLTLLPACVMYGYQGILIAAITGIVSETIYRILNRI
tara:strand:+ start:2056 stop:2280 length:225 start_codon:yes stop_codon:yes gene_type:complete